MNLLKHGGNLNAFTLQSDGKLHFMTITDQRQQMLLTATSFSKLQCAEQVGSSDEMSARILTVPTEVFRSFFQFLQANSVVRQIRG